MDCKELNGSEEECDWVSENHKDCQEIWVGSLTAALLDTEKQCRPHKCPSAGEGVYVQICSFCGILCGQENE